MIRVYLPTLKQLQYFLALAQYNHFGQAALACNVTQSTLSAGIRDLETLLGVTLVERTRRIVRLTSLGQALVAKAHRVLREAEELADMAAAAGKPLTGELRMSVIPTIAPFLLPSLLPKLRRQRPQLKLFLREETSAQACNSLHQGRADCILLALPYACGDVKTEALFDDPILAAFPSDQAAGLPRNIAAHMLDPDQLLMLEDGHCLKDHALAACNRPELRNQTQMIGTSLHTLVQMVDNGLGVTMLPKMAITAGILDNTNIETRALDSDHDWRTIALVWRQSSPRIKEFQLLAKIFRDHYVNNSTTPKIAN